MHGEEGLAAGRCAAVDGDMNEYFLDLTHCRAARQRASRIDRQLLIPTQRRENAQGQQRLRLTIKRRPAPRPPPRQLGDEVLERHHELIRPSQVRVDEILAGGHSGDDTGSNWLNHGSQVENEPAEACVHAPSTPVPPPSTPPTPPAKSVLGEAAHRPAVGVTLIAQKGRLLDPPQTAFRRPRHDLGRDMDSWLALLNFRAGGQLPSPPSLPLTFGLGW